MILKAHIVNTECDHFTESKIYISSVWISLPINLAKFDEALHMIGIHDTFNIALNNPIIDSYYSEEELFSKLLTENIKTVNLYELTELGEILEDIDDNEKFKAVIESYIQHTEIVSLKSIINYLKDFEKFDYIPAKDENELAHKIISEIGICSISNDSFEKYFDFERYGEEIAKDYCKTSDGYINYPDQCVEYIISKMKK